MTKAWGSKIVVQLFPSSLSTYACCFYTLLICSKLLHTYHLVLCRPVSNEVICISAGGPGHRCLKAETVLQLISCLVALTCLRENSQRLFLLRNLPVEPIAMT